MIVATLMCEPVRCKRGGVLSTGFACKFSWSSCVSIATSFAATRHVTLGKTPFLHICHARGNLPYGCKGLVVLVEFFSTRVSLCGARVCGAFDTLEA